VAGSPTPSESLLSEIVQSPDDAIVSKDLNSIVTSWNPAAEQMFGLPLTVHGRTIGALTFATAESERHYDADDIHIAHDAAARTALAYDNARAYEQLQAATTVPHSLQLPNS
jgi:GAF domain-containing protein